jgi:hypothetical protein
MVNATWRARMVVVQVGQLLAHSASLSINTGRKTIGFMNGSYLKQIYIVCGQFIILYYKDTL